MRTNRPATPAASKPSEPRKHNGKWPGGNGADLNNGHVDGLAPQLRADGGRDEPPGTAGENAALDAEEPPAQLNNRHLGASRVADNVMVLGMAQIVTWVCTAAMVIFMPRFLGDVDLGKFAVGGTILGFLLIAADLGTTSFLTKEVARTASPKQIAGYVANSLALRLPLTIVAALAGVAIVNLLGYDWETKLVFYLMLPGLILISVNQILGAGLQGLQEMRPMAFSGAISRAIQVSATLALLALGEGIATIAPLTWLPAFIGLGIGSYALFRRVGFSTRINRDASRSVLFGSLPFLLWNASLAIYGSVDIIMLSLMTDEAVVGWYNAAYRIIAVPVFIPTILGMALMPALSQTAAADRSSFGTMVRQSLRISMVTMLPLALGTVVLADKVVDLLAWPEEFRKSIPLMAILALHMPIVGVTTVLGTALIAMDKQRVWALVGLGAAILNPSFNYLFIPITQDAFENGAIGAASVTVCTEFLMLAMAVRMMPKGALDRQTASMAARCLTAGGLMVVSVWLIRDLGLIPCVILGGCIYGAASLILKTMTVEDGRRVVHVVVTRLPGRRRLRAEESAAAP